MSDERRAFFHIGIGDLGLVRMMYAADLDTPTSFWFFAHSGGR